jgi:hypothetical protein
MTKSKIWMLRIARAGSMAAMSATVLQMHIGMSVSARADGLEKQGVVDVSLIICGELLRMPLAQALVLVGWVGGFYAGRENDTKVEIPAFVDEADRVISLCRENESMRLMTLVDEDLRRRQGEAGEPVPTTAPP